MPVLTVNTNVENPVIILTAVGYTQDRNTIVVDEGTTVSVRIEKDGYKRIVDDVVVNENVTKFYEMEMELYTVKIDQYPADSRVSTILNGIELVGNKREAHYGDLVEFRVSKKGYEERKGVIHVKGNEVQKVILLVDREAIVPTAEEYKERRDLSENYPSTFTDRRLLKQYVESIENPFFEKPSEVSVEGYIGTRESSNGKNDQFIEEPTADRQLNQISPVGVIDTNGNKEVLTFNNFVSKLELAGVPTENQNKFLSGKQWSWCPLINIDMFLNYSMYHWLGYDHKTLPLIKLLDSTNAIQNIIAQPEYTYVGRVQICRGETVVAEYEKSITLGNGLRIMFTADANEEYNNIPYFVGSVGSSIELIADEIDNEDTTQDYYVCEQGSIDRNEWSLANRWVHRRVLEQMIPDSLKDYDTAHRPIMCYQKDYALYNYGTNYRGSFDIAYDGLPSEINGKAVDQVQGVPVYTGMKIVFFQMPEEDMHQLFAMNVLDSGIVVLEPIYNGKNIDDLANTERGDYIRIERGTYKGETRHFDGDGWVISQTKTKVNQAPLFELYDSDGVYIGSKVQYPYSTFAGAVLFDYVESTNKNAIVDHYIGKRIITDEYGNYQFDNKIGSVSYSYIDGEGVSQKIEGYMYAKNLKTGAFNNGWLYKATSAIQKLKTRLILKETDLIDGKVFSYVIPFSSFRNLIVRQNGEQKTVTGIEFTDTGFSLTSCSAGDEILVTLVADDFDIVPVGYAFDLPASFTSNQFNEDIKQIGYSDCVEHFSGILSNQVGFDGNANGSNNSYSLDIDGSLGEKIIQADNPILLPMTLENNPKTDVLAAIEYAKQSYRVVMTKVTNLAKRMIKNGEISEADYSAYQADLTMLDEVIVKIFKQINLGKTDKSPFYNNGVAYALGELYIPATPAYLGLEQPVKPKMVVVDGKTYVQCHDGALVEANSSVADLIRLELEHVIYSSILSRFKSETPLFEKRSVESGYFRNAIYTRQQISDVYARYFINWANDNDLDYSGHLNGSSDDWKDWNWSACQMADGTQLKGSYRAINYWFYDTFDPSETPWEMLGFADEPSWWTDVYGEKPWTSNNKVLWEDLEKGYVRGGLEPEYRLEYARPGLVEHFIPVDSQGKLKSPYEIGISMSNPSAVARKKNWEIGDIGEVEAKYMRTSDFRFSREEVCYILRPVEWVGTNWDTKNIEIKYRGTLYQQTIDKDTQTRPSLKNTTVHNQIIDGIPVRKIGVQQWVSDFLSKENLSIADNIINRLNSLRVCLSYRAAGFIEGESLAIRYGTDLIPTDNYKVMLLESRTSKMVSYSAVSIIKTDFGFELGGFDRLNPKFVVRKPYEAGRKTSKDVNGTHFVLYNDYLDETQTYYYGHIFEKLNDVVTFLRAYQKHLTDDENVIFTGLNEYGEINDFTKSAETLMQWGTTLKADAKEIPSFIADPAMFGLAARHFGSAHNLKEKVSGFDCALDIYRKPIKSEDLSVMRSSYQTDISVVNSAASLFRIPICEFESVILIDNETIFGELLYNPVYSAMASAFKVSAIKVGQWDGSLYSPGYLNMEDGIIPNLEKNVFDLNYVFDVDTIRCQTKYRNYARTLVGFEKTEYMQNLIQNEKSMFDFYKGMIQDKGTVKPIIAMNNASDVSGEQQDIDSLLYEYWAIKAGEYGQLLGNACLEFLLEKDKLITNPQLITYTIRSGDLSITPYTVTYDSSNWLRKNTVTPMSNLATVYQKDDVIPAVGYVSVEDCDYVVADEAELVNTSDDIEIGQTVFVVEKSNREWDVVKKTGINRYVSMRYKSLLDAYKQKNQSLVYSVVDNGNQYYTEYADTAIQPEDAIYSDIDLTNKVGEFKDLHTPVYTGKEFEYVAGPAFKSKIGNTVFRSTTQYQQINKSTVFYCYADGKYYTYSNMLMKVGSAGVKVFSYQYLFTIIANTHIDNPTFTINGQAFTISSRQIVIAVEDGDVIDWSVSAPHCETISGHHEINGHSFTITANLRYKENEVLYDTRSLNSAESKFIGNRVKFACAGSYQVVVTGAGGGAGGGSTYYKKPKWYQRGFFGFVFKAALLNLAFVTGGLSVVAAYGSVIGNSSKRNKRSGGAGGGGGSYASFQLNLADSDVGYANIVCGKGGAGGAVGRVAGNSGYVGSDSYIEFTSENNHSSGFSVRTTAGVGGMGAQTGQVWSGAVDYEGRQLEIGAGGKVYSQINLANSSITSQSFADGISAYRINGAGGAASMNPLGYRDSKPLYNESGFGGRPVYMGSGQAGDNGSVTVKFLKHAAGMYVPFTEEIVTTKKSLLVYSDSIEYSKVFQIFMLNTLMRCNPTPVAWTDAHNADGSSRYYSFDDCVSYNDRKYRCINSHVANKAVEVSGNKLSSTYWEDYTDYTTIEELPMYAYDVTEEDPVRPDAKIFTDATEIFKHRAKQITGRHATSVRMNVWNSGNHYVVNDTTTYIDGKFYRCVADTSGEWDASKWVEYLPTYWFKYLEDGNDVKGFYPLYYDEDCTQAVIDDYNIQLLARDMIDVSYGTVYNLVDSMGNYGTLKLNYMTEPYWSTISSVGNYSVQSSGVTYYSDTNQDALENYIGTDNDKLYMDIRQGEDTLARQFNNVPLKYENISDVNTDDIKVCYELSDGDILLYTTKSYGLIENDDPIYTDSSITTQDGVYKDYVPTWEMTSYIPNGYDLTRTLPVGEVLYTKSGDNYNKYADNLYVLESGVYINFVPSYIGEMTDGYAEVLYNDGTANDYVSLYRKNGDAYAKVTGVKLYVPVQNLHSTFYFGTDTITDTVTAVVKSGESSADNGDKAYFNGQCVGDWLSMSQILSKTAETVKVKLYSAPNDIARITANSLLEELAQRGITPTYPDFENIVADESEMYSDRLAEDGEFVHAEDIKWCALNPNDKSEVMIRIMEEYHYFYGEDNYRQYVKLFKYGKNFYKLVSTGGKICEDIGVLFGNYDQITTFTKAQSGEVTEAKAVNYISYKALGDLVYIDSDIAYRANMGDYSDVLADKFGLLNESSAKSNDGVKAWMRAEVYGTDYQFNLAAIENYQADNTVLDGVYLLDNKTSRNVSKFGSFDPMQGVFPNGLLEEINYISADDPIGDYTTLQNLQRVNDGDLWLDISKMKYVNYKSGHSNFWWNPIVRETTDDEYRAENWGARLESSDISVYEWTTSNSTPADENTKYLTKLEYNKDTDKVETTYSYWVKNPSNIPVGVHREHSAVWLADTLGSVMIGGSSCFAFVSTDEANQKSSFIISNYATFANGIDAVVQINTDRNKYADSHTDWDMVRENSTDNISDTLWDKLKDSIIGERKISDAKILPVPDPTLPESMRYGIDYRPRQTMIKDKYEAKRNLVGILNSITLNRTFTDVSDTDSDLVKRVDEPSNYSYTVQSYGSLQTLIDERLVGSRVLVKYDETHNNIWTIYRMYGVGKFVLEDWQEYDIFNYIEYADLYANPNIPKYGVLTTVKNLQELAAVQASVGDIVKVSNDDGWFLYQYNDTKAWELVGKQNGLIKFNAALYSNDLVSDTGVFIDLNGSPYWNSQKYYELGQVVKYEDGEEMKFYKCTAAHTSNDAFDTNESIKWLEIKNESLYDYLKKEGNYILDFIFDYFGRA